MKPYVMMQEENQIYDLYAVVNHSGSLGGGHYTAQCYNETDQQWHNFNDSSVSLLKLDKDSIPKGMFG